MSLVLFPKIDSARVNYSLLHFLTLSTLISLPSCNRSHQSSPSLPRHRPYHHGYHLLSTKLKKSQLKNARNRFPIQIILIYSGSFLLFLRLCSSHARLYPFYLLPTFSRSPSQGAFPLLILIPSHSALCLLFFFFSGVISYPGYPCYYHDSSHYCLSTASTSISVSFRLYMSSYPPATSTDQSLPKPPLHPVFATYINSTNGKPELFLRLMFATRRRKPHSKIFLATLHASCTPPLGYKGYMFPDFSPSCLLETS